MKLKLLILSFVLPFVGCYYNPFVNQLLVPEEAKDSSSSLGLLALSPTAPSTSNDATMQVEGQIKSTNGSNLANPTLTLATSSSLRAEAVSTTYRANANGRFLLKLRPGVFIFNVTSSAGTSLGTITLTVSSTNTVSSVISSDAQFQVASLVSHELGATVTLAETETVPPTITSTTPANGATGVTVFTNSGMGNRLQTDFTAYFSESIDQSTLTGANITISPSAPPSLEFTPSSNSVFVAIHTNVGGNTLYTLTFGNGIRDLAGNALSPVSIQFTTGGLP